MHTVLRAVGFKPAYDIAVGVGRRRRVISWVGVPPYEEAPIGLAKLVRPRHHPTGSCLVRAYVEELPDVPVDPGVPDEYRVMDERRALTVLLQP